MRRFCGDCLSANFSEVGTGLGDIGIFDWLFFYDFRARPPAGGRGLSANSSEVGTGLVEIGIVDQLFFYDFRARPPAGGRRPPGRKATGLGGERPRREGVQGPGLAGARVRRAHGNGGVVRALSPASPLCELLQVPAQHLSRLHQDRFSGRHVLLPLLAQDRPGRWPSH